MRFHVSVLVLCAVMFGTFAATLTDLGTNGTRVVGDSTGNYFRVRVRGGYEGVVSVRVTGSRSVKLNTLCRFLPQRVMFGTSANPGTVADAAASHTFSFNVSSDTFDWNDCFVLTEYTSSGSSLSNITLTSSVYGTDLRRILVDAGAFVFNGVTFNAATGNRVWAYFLATTRTPYSWAAALDGTPFHTDYNSRDGLSTSNGLITGRTYRVRSILPSIDFSGSVAVSLTTSYQVWPSSGSATVTLKGLQPVFAYWKVQIPTASSNQIQNHNLNVKFTSGNSADRVQVYTSSLPTFSPLNSIRTDITPGPTGARAAIPACAVDTANSVVYVVVVYAPANANSTAIDAGSLSVSATIDYTSSPATPTAASTGSSLTVGNTYLLSNLGAGDIISVSGTDVSFRWGIPQLLTTDGSNCTGIANLPSGVSVASSGFSTCDLDTVASSAALQLVTGSGQGTLTRTSPISIPTNGTAVVGTVPANGAVFFSAASTQFPIAITVRPNTAAASFAEFNNANTIFNGARCAATSLTTFTITSEPESIVVLGCPGEALKITQFSRAFSVKQVGSVGTTVTRNVIARTSGDAHSFDLAPNTPLIVRFNINGLVSLVVTANISYQAGQVHIRRMPGGDFCAIQPSNFAALPVIDFGAGSSAVALGPETVFMATSVASRITFTYTSSSDAVPQEAPTPSIPFGCVADASLIPAACSSALPGSTKIFNSQNYDKAALQTLIADEIEHFSILENLGATGACYNAFVKEACLFRVPRCNATNAIVNDGCFEQCIVRLTAAGCASSEPATPLHYCSLLPFCPVDRIPIATYVGPVVDRNQAPATVNIPPVSAGSAPTASGTAPSASSTPVAQGAPVAPAAPSAPSAPAAPKAPGAASAPKATSSAYTFQPVMIATIAFVIISLLF